MAHARSTFIRRSAVALSSIALSLSLCLGGIPHASADPYDADDTTEVVTADPGFDTSDYGSWTQDDGGYAAPEQGPRDWGSDPDLQSAPDEPADQTGDDDATDPSPPFEAPYTGSDEPGFGSEPTEPETEVALEDQGRYGDQGQFEDQDPLDLNAGSDAVAVPDQVDAADLTTAEAERNDVDLALSSTPVTAEPEPAATSDVEELRAALATEITSTTTVTDWSSSVTQWNSSWLSYDTYYRPVITNPYRSPLQVIYRYGDTTRIVTVAPLERAVFAAPTPGVYSFTALTRADSGAVATVSTGSFSGGGYVPGRGQQPPSRPPALTTFENALVQIRYSTGASQPFRVKLLTDLGDDPAVGARRVLLDEETPVWGQWSKTPSGERLFQVTKTQQLPGLTDPAEAPLPGYDVQLAGNEATQSNSAVDIAVIAAIACGVLGLAAVGFVVISGRRRRT